METKIIDGKKIAKDVREEVAQAVADIRKLGCRAPKLSVVLVGDNPASQSYVRGKEKACREVGMESETIVLPHSITQMELLAVVESLNQDETVDGILVQLPLPDQIDVEAVVQAVSPQKDVDCFHVQNIGAMARGGGQGFLPCTPSGVIELLERSGIEAEGKHCVVVGRSNLVGKPAALLLLEKNATVTMCHSRTADIAAFCREADILVVAAGKPGLVTGEMLKEGAVVIDVGIHRTEKGLCGDVDTESCLGIASAITPVPGGMGPMTVAMLMKNCLKAYEMGRKA